MDIRSSIGDCDVAKEVSENVSYAVDSNEDSEEGIIVSFKSGIEVGPSVTI